MSDPTPGVRTLAVDDQQRFRETLRDLVAATAGFVLVGLAASADEAIRAVAELSPELVLMDVRMPGTDGIEATRAILRRHPDLMVVLISVDDPLLFAGATSLGDSVACVRKQELDPHCLKQLWNMYTA